MIGAGIAGLSCARELVANGLQPTLFEKSRGPGGRCATRRVEDLRFDHGFSCLTEPLAGFADPVPAWHAAGVLAPWRPVVVESESRRHVRSFANAARLVGVSGMNGVGKHLAADLDLRTEATVTGLRPTDLGWHVATDVGPAAAGFDAAVVAVPAGQAVPLLASAPALAATAARASHMPCWTAMVAFSEPLDLGFDAAEDPAPELSWTARETSKPGRAAVEAWVLHATADWSRANLEAARADSATRLLAALNRAAGRALPPPVHLVGHRWRYAKVDQAAGAECLWDPALGLGACGDWCPGGGVMAAWRSGRALAQRMVDALGAPGARRAATARD